MHILIESIVLLATLGVGSEEISSFQHQIKSNEAICRALSYRCSCLKWNVRVKNSVRGLLSEGITIGIFTFLDRDQGRWFTCTKVNWGETERMWEREIPGKCREENLREARGSWQHRCEYMHDNPEGGQFYLFHQERISSIHFELDSRIT